MNELLDPRTLSHWPISATGLEMVWVRTADGLQMHWTRADVETQPAVVEFDGVRHPQTARAA